MLQIFPFLAWLAIIVSAALLVMLWATGELGRREGGVVLGWLLLAGYCQFLGGSVVSTTAGLVLQTVLAIYLTLRWKATG